MFKDKPMKVNRRGKKNSLAPVLWLLATAAVLALVFALVWQKMGGKPEDAPSSTASVLASSSQPEPESKPVSSSVSSSEPAPESKPQEPVVIKGAVPESERVMGTYFDDAAFVGDSITEGIGLYGLMSNSTVLAGTGINLNSIYTKEVIKQEDGSRISVIDALKQKPYKKLYVMLGGNEAKEDEQTFRTNYGRLLGDLKQLQPDALIYVQSILPVTPDNVYGLENNHIDLLNKVLAELSEEKGLYYLNVAECMKDEKGMLPEEASPADGMHFGPDYYKKWFEYLKTHTI